MSTVVRERRRRRKVVPLRTVGSVGIALVLLAGLMGFPLEPISDGRQTVSAGATGAGVGPGGAQVVPSPNSFSIVGKARTPIAPGRMSPLDLTFSNPDVGPVSVTGLRVTVRKVNAPNADDAHPCAVGDFTVTQVSSDIKITVAARGTSTLSSLGLPAAKWPQVGILERSVNQDGCKGASLTLGYSASGTVDK